MLDLPWDAGLFAAPEQPVIVYTGVEGAAPEVAAPVEVVRLEAPTPTAVLADLRARGVRALACEGGPVLFGALLADGLVDELFLTLVPLLTGEVDAHAGDRGRRPPRARARRAAVGAARGRRAVPALRALACRRRTSTPTPLRAWAVLWGAMALENRPRADVQGAATAAAASTIP